MAIGIVKLTTEDVLKQENEKLKKELMAAKRKIKELEAKKNS